MDNTRSEAKSAASETTPEVIPMSHMDSTSGQAQLLAVNAPFRLQATTSESDVLNSLPPPPPFDLRVANLTIGVPPPSQYLPLPIPVPIPKFLLRKRNNDDTRSKTILTDVSAECHAGEMLAM